MNAVTPLAQRLNLQCARFGIILRQSDTRFDWFGARTSGHIYLDLELSALEGERHAKVIARPRVVTSNQQKAMIQTGEEIPYQESSSSGATSVAFKKAVLSLEITPQNYT